MNRRYLLLSLLTLVLFPLVSSAEITSPGDSCFGNCPVVGPLTPHGSFGVINNSVTFYQTQGYAIDSSIFIPQSFLQIYNATVTFTGLNYSTYSVLDAYLDNKETDSENFYFNFTINNSVLQITGITLNITGSNSGNIYFWNYSSSSFVEVGSCIDFCAFPEVLEVSTWYSDYVSSELLRVWVDAETTDDLNLSINYTLSNSTSTNYITSANLSLLSNGSVDFQIWNSTNFTESNSSGPYDIGQLLRARYPNGGSGATSIPFNITAEGTGRILIANFSVHYEPAPSGGGGGPTTPVDDSSDSSSSSSVIKIPGNNGWTLEAGNGIGRYDIITSPGSDRDFTLKLTNNGLSARTISFECEDIIGGICQHVTFEDPEFKLLFLRNTTQVSKFNINLPEEIEKDTYQFDILAKDDLGQGGAVNVFVSVSSIGLFVDTLIKLFKVTSFGVPYIIIFIPILIFGLILFTRLLKNNPLGPLWAILISFTLAFVSIPLTDYFF